MKEEALDRPLWKTRFGRRYGPLIRQTADSIYEYHQKKRRILKEKTRELAFGKDQWVLGL